MIRRIGGLRIMGSAGGRARRGSEAAASLLVAAVLVLIVCPSALAAPLGQITEFSSGLQAGNASILQDIAAGPDGNLWFTDESCQGISGNPCAIGRITPSGTITEFPIGLSSDPFDIAAGPDGNLWFTNDTIPAAIGRISPS